jgi:hypothetical protein
MFAAKEETFGCGIGIGAMSHVAKLIHFLIKIVEGYGVYFHLASEVLFWLIGFLESDEVVLLFDLFVAGESQVGDIGGWVDVDCHFFPF